MKPTSPRSLCLVGGIAAVYLATLLALRGLRPEHVVLAVTVVAIGFGGPRIRVIGRFFLPLVLMLAIYDAQRFWVDPLRARIRVAEPRAWELAWFGVTVDGGTPQTPAAWWQHHTHPVLDVVCGAAYLAFVPSFLAAAAWWRFGRKLPQADAVMWAMLWLNLAGYLVYLLYPAAPPWYVDHYGLGPAQLTVPPEAAGATRFDAALGVHVFADYYGRNANVFGAIPSLHVGQTFLAAWFAWRFRSLRALTTGLFALVFFASVYLNHHYVVDGLAGIALALAAGTATAIFFRRRPGTLPA